MNSCETTFTKPSPEPVLRAKHSSASKIIVQFVRGYQYLTAGRTSACRFYPSCSQYAVTALTDHGAVRGSYLAMRRVLRCNPFGPHGVDLVPERQVGAS